MKTRPRNCRGGSSSSVLALYKFSLVVIWPLLAGGLAWGQNQAAQPSAVTERAQDHEAKYQTALAKGQEAQRNYFFVTALWYYQEALKAKPGDEVATKLQSEMRAKIAARVSGAETPGAATAPPVGAPPVSVPSQAVSPPATPAEQPVTPPATEVSSIVSAMPTAPKATKHEISAAGDLFFGQGNVTIPFFFALQAFGIPGTVSKPDLSSVYYGGTLSYSYGQALFLDLAYAHGSSSGNVPVDFFTTTTESSFNITDDWYQAYLRYTLLRGIRWYAYLRGGVTYVQAKMTDAVTLPPPFAGFYRQTADTEDLLGNLGFGVSYSLYNRGRFRASLLVEGEAFYGHRSQAITEYFYSDPYTANIDNDLYGGIGRGMAHFEYHMGREGLMKLFADGGIQARFADINYTGLGTFSELLWGPYLRLGLRYDF
jgi:hypothetical protein